MIIIWTEDGIVAQAVRSLLASSDRPRRLAELAKLALIKQFFACMAVKANGD